MHMCSGSKEYRLQTSSTSACRALRTVCCQMCALFAVWPCPDPKSIKLAIQLAHLSCPASRSRIIMSWRPSQFAPSPSQLSDQIPSQPLTELCFNRKASRVLKSSLAMSEPGRNFASRTANMPFQSLPKPAYVRSSRAPSGAFCCRASWPERRAKSSACAQNFRALKAASAFLKLRAVLRSQGAVMVMPLGVRSWEFPRKAEQHKVSQTSSQWKPTTLTSEPSNGLRGSLKCTAPNFDTCASSRRLSSSKRRRDRARCRARHRSSMAQYMRQSNRYGQVIAQ
mmetsp:Transcript_11536/g.24228  ORF Transcript_11536/g.24228 Transcript_11536/m.24228 type:complete len:282 (+) Transcript_11536:789-1634(+)